MILIDECGNKSLVAYNKELLESFGIKHAGSRLLGKGWGNPEDEFVWSEGKFAEISLPIDASHGTVSLGVWGFVPERAPPQEVLVFVNGRFCHYASVSAHVIIPINFDFDHLENGVSIGLYMPSARRPSDFAVSDDDRMLGLALSSIVVEYE